MGPPKAVTTLGWCGSPPHAELYSRANDPLLLLRELGELGEVVVVANVEEMPGLGEFEPFGVYCSWDVQITSETVTEDKIREVFEFVEGDCDIEITKGAALAAETKDEAEDDLDLDDGPSLADLLTEVEPEPKKKPAAPVAQQPAGAAAGAPADGGGKNDHEHEHAHKPVGVQSIRVDLDKVDRVVNMVSELVITQSMLTQQMDENLRQKYQELVRGLEILAQTTRGLQDSVMAIRAQPVKSVFSRMPRLVRELAGKTGKKIRLETVGENTEIRQDGHRAIVRSADAHDPQLRRPRRRSDGKSALRPASPKPASSGSRPSRRAATS